MLLNSDVEVTEHWLVPLVNYMDAHPEVAACQPKIRSWRQKGTVRICRSGRRIYRPLRLSLCRGRIMSAVEKDNGHVWILSFLCFGLQALPCLSVGKTIWMPADWTDVFRPYGRDRLVLATSCPRADAGLCYPKVPFIM